MNKTQTAEANRQELAAMIAKIDTLLKITANAETRKALQEVLTAGLDAQFAARAGFYARPRQRIFKLV
jgi:hypothetical protein